MLQEVGGASVTRGQVCARSRIIGALINRGNSTGQSTCSLAVRLFLMNRAVHRVQRGHGLARRSLNGLVNIGGTRVSHVRGKRGLAITAVLGIFGTLSISTGLRVTKGSLTLG